MAEKVVGHHEITNKETKFYDNFKEYGYNRSIFMIGITGAGKSTFCNFLANEKRFEVSFGFASKHNKQVHV